MKKYLLPQNGNFYKANLHTHTTLSDGKNTPEQVKKMYKEEGYSVLAYTDHNDFYNHNDLSDPDFLVLNGCEDGVATVVTSPAKYIHFNTKGRGAKVARGTKDEPVTTCSFKINPDCDGYIRVTVTDFEGNHANSNAYFIDEMFE